MGTRRAADGDGPRKGIFIGLSAGTSGSAGGSLAGGFGAIDAVFHPSASRAREELERQHEAVVPTPSPGDTLLDEGRIVISLPQDTAEAAH